MTTPRVLLVDGDADTRTILRVALGHYGYAVSDAADAEAALRIARQVEPDVVVSELWVPSARGSCMFAAVLRHDPRAHRARVLVLTTRTQRADVEAARRAGVDRLHAKPVHLESLLADVSHLVREGPAASPPDGIAVGPELLVSLGDGRRGLLPYV